MADVLKTSTTDTTARPLRARRAHPVGLAVPPFVRSAAQVARYRRSSMLPGLAIIAVIALAGCGAMGRFSPLAPVERSQVFHPVKYPAGNWDDVGIDYEDVWFEAADGTTLHGWFVLHPRTRAVVLFAHGNAGNLSHRIRTLQELHGRQQVSVLIFDYRGYGKSEGSPDEAGLLQDARAARTWLANRTGIPEREVVLMGRSLGGGVMVDLAAKDGARGLILENTFTSLPDVAQRLAPYLPAKLLMSNRFDSVSKIANYRGPLLQTHGDRDGLVPIALARQLHAAANDPKQFVAVPGGGHNSPRTVEYHAALWRFFESLSRRVPGSTSEARPF
ncbi:MAG: alpha/beta hydrolase [Planctomycetaceae bacterium]